jgi:FkbM family methyltransferase
MRPPASLRRLARAVLRRAGLRRDAPAPSRAGALVDYGVDCVLDVGANVGQSGAEFRRALPRAKVVSFEPVRRLFDGLAQAASGDPLWHVENVALGLEPGTAEIHVSGGHGGASSLLPMTENVLTHAPDQRVVGTETVRVDTLAAAIDRHYPAGDRCFVKVDVQGYERHVLEGGRSRLDRVVGLKVDAALVENYEGGSRLLDLLPWLHGLGYRVVALEPGWRHPTTDELFEVDAVLFRTERRLRGAPGPSRRP